jgi:DNA-binding response OmpR family regulator
MNTADKPIETDEEFYRHLARPKEVLLVEDDPGLIDLFGSLTQYYNFVYDVCNTGEKAFEMFKSKKYDVVFLDLRLPIRHGSEVFRDIREYDQTARIYIMSAYLTEQDIQRISEMGSASFIWKPHGFGRGFLEGVFARAEIKPKQI